MSVWMCGLWMSSNFFQIATSTVFLRFSQNLTHIIYVPIRKKTVEQIFKILISKIFGNFFQQLVWSSDKLSSWSLCFYSVIHKKNIPFVFLNNL